MKIILVALSGLSAMMIGCKKTNSDVGGSVQTKISTKIIRATMIEFGTGKVINDASVELSLSKTVFPDNNWEAFAARTDNQGRIEFRAGYFKNLKIKKDGYWDYNVSERGWTFSEFSRLFPGGVSFIDAAYQDTYTCDSFTVSLVPKTFINIHIKDTSAADRSGGPGSVIRTYGVNREGIYLLTGDQLNLRAHIDTVIRYPVFGNADNLISVTGTNLVSRGIDDYFPSIIYYYNRNLFIGRDSIANVHVIF